MSRNALSVFDSIKTLARSLKISCKIFAFHCIFWNIMVQKKIVLLVVAGVLFFIITLVSIIFPIVWFFLAFNVSKGEVFYITQTRVMITFQIKF